MGILFFLNEGILKPRDPETKDGCGEALGAGNAGWREPQQECGSHSIGKGLTTRLYGL